MSKTFLSQDIDDYCTQHSGHETDMHRAIAEQALDFAPQTPDMSSDRLAGAVLRTLVAIKQPKSILEVGTFVGYSTLCMLEGYADGKITCLDWDERTVKMATERFAGTPYENRVHIIQGDASESMQNHLNHDQFDFIFIDADKRSYLHYVQWCYDHMPIGGVLVLDNALWKGRVVNPQSLHDKGVDNANKWLAEHKGLVNAMIPVRDGMHIVVKVA